MTIIDMPFAVMAVYLPLILIIGYLAVETVYGLVARFRHFELIHPAEMSLPESARNTATKSLARR